MKQIEVQTINEYLSGRLSDWFSLKKKEQNSRAGKLLPNWHMYVAKTSFQYRCNVLKRCIDTETTLFSFYFFTLHRR